MPVIEIQWSYRITSPSDQPSCLIAMSCLSHTPSSCMTKKIGRRRGLRMTSALCSPLKTGRRNTSSCTVVSVQVFWYFLVLFIKCWKHRTLQVNRVIVLCLFTQEKHIKAHDLLSFVPSMSSTQNNFCFDLIACTVLPAPITS